MIYFKPTSNKIRWIAAGLTGTLSVVLFVLYPELFSRGVIDLRGPAAYVLPLFSLLVIGCLLLDVQSGSLSTRVVLKLLMTWLCVFMLICVTEITATDRMGVFLRYAPWRVLMASLFMCVIMGVLYAVIGSLPWALRITAIILSIYSIVNYFVLQFRGTPFIPIDIAGAGTAMDVVSAYQFTFSQELATALFVLIGVLLIAPKVALPVKKRASRWLTRVGALAASGAFVMVTMTGPYLTNHDYEPNFWNQNVSAERSGTFMNFVANISYSLYEEPEGYSLAAVNEIASQYPSDSAGSAAVKPDVVLILGESWADMTAEGLAQTNIPVMPFLDSFQNRSDGIYRKLMASSHGGGTSLSEFQILTGSSPAYGMHSAPFQQNVRSDIPSLAWQFKQLGYETTAIHSGEPSAWERDRAFPLMGFDQFLDRTLIQTDKSKWIRYYLSDEVMFNKALEMMEEATEPQFMYLLTIQTHGGYSYEGYTSSIQIESPAGDYPQAEQYLSLLHESDSQVESFINALQERDRPTLVVIFGDHKPAVGGSYPGYLQAQMGDDYKSWQYETFYIMWANYDLPESVINSPDTISMNYLGGQLISAAELPLTGYQKFLQDGMGEMPVVSGIEIVDANGKQMTAEQAEKKTVYQQQAITQYNLLYDRENLPETFFELAQ